MKDNSLYELTVEKKHIEIMIKALNNYMCAQYDGIDLDIVNVPVTMENIKIAADMQLVLKHQLGKTRHTPKQTSQSTGLVWCKEVDLDIQEEQFSQYNDEYLQKTDEQRQKELNGCIEYTKYCLDTFLKNQPKGNDDTLTKAWDNVKERHWDTIKQMGDK